MAGRAQKYCLEGATEGELLLCVAPKSSTKASTHYGEQAVALFFVSLARGSYFDSYSPSSVILLHDKDNPLQCFETHLNHTPRPTSSEQRTHAML